MLDVRAKLCRAVLDC